MSMICEIINSLAAKPGPVFSISNINVMWDLEAAGAHTLRLD